MAITTRLGKGSALTHTELDTNFTDLDTRSNDNDTRLTTLENQDLDIRITAIENDTLDARLDVLEGYTLDTRVTTNDNRLTNLESENLDARLDVLEGYNISTRITSLESDALDASTRLGDLETGKYDITGGDLTGTLGVLGVKETVVSLGNTTGSLEVDTTTGTVFELTATGAISFEGFTNPVAGQSATLFVTQNGSGTWSDIVAAKYAKAISSLSIQANLVDVITIFYNGSEYYISISKGFE